MSDCGQFMLKTSLCKNTRNGPRSRCSLWNVSRKAPSCFINFCVSVFVQTFKTVLARGAHCGMFLAHFYNARLWQFLYFIMKKRVAISDRLVYCGFYNNGVMPDLFGHRLSR